MSDRLEVRGLSVGNIVVGVDLTVHAGELCALVGESGAGKSLVLQALLGICPLPVTYTQFSVTEALAYVPQDPVAALDPLTTVGHQIGRSAIAAGRSADPLPWLAEVQLPPDTAHRYPHTCSGGMAQRVVLAQALARDARWLLADEPMTGLDPTRTAAVVSLLRDAVDKGLGVVLVTHDLGLLPGLADAVVLMHEGRAIETVRPGDPAALQTEVGRALWAATAGVST